MTTRKKAGFNDAELRFWWEQTHHDPKLQAKRWWNSLTIEEQTDYRTVRAEKRGS